VACSACIAQLRRRTWGVTRFAAIDCAALPDRLQRLVARAVQGGVDADAFRRAMVDGNEHRHLAVLDGEGCGHVIRHRPRTGGGSINLLIAIPSGKLMITSNFLVDPTGQGSRTMRSTPRKARG
jgi:hypothetical protein